jgi:hypothetical protein
LTINKNCTCLELSEYASKFVGSNTSINNHSINNDLIKNHNLRLKKLENAQNFGITGLFKKETLKRKIRKIKFYSIDFNKI